MAAYGDFAYWYDLLNQQADYDTLAHQLKRQFTTQGINKGIIADLGCGTGELSLRLQKAGYDMIAVDASPEMLAVFRQKLQQGDKPLAKKEVLLLCQDIAALDLYGTVQGAASTFDTLNHLTAEQLQKAFARVSLFLETNGLFIFDVNTIYKHRHVLANNTFLIETPQGSCHWHNHFNKADDTVSIRLEMRQNRRIVFCEEFCEYAYPMKFWQDLLVNNGLECIELLDGESFGPVDEDSCRWLFTAKKIR